jgi:hypothetical protein
MSFESEGGTAIAFNFPKKKQRYVTSITIDGEREDTNDTNLKRIRFKFNYNRKVIKYYST